MSQRLPRLLVVGTTVDLANARNACKAIGITPNLIHVGSTAHGLELLRDLWMNAVYVALDIPGEDPGSSTIAFLKNLRQVAHSTAPVLVEAGSRNLSDMESAALHEWRPQLAFSVEDIQKILKRFPLQTI